MICAKNPRTTATAPATINARFHPLISAKTLATNGPAKDEKEKNTQIRRAWFGHVFSEIVFIKGPRSIESPKPKHAKQIICSTSPSKNGKTTSEPPETKRPILTKFLGEKISLTGSGDIN